MDYHKHFRDRLYPLQDKFLRFLEQVNGGRFYLTGGTALSRFYFQHRYSDDLDFFSVRELEDFRSVTGEILGVAKKQGHLLEVETFSDHFLRAILKEDETSLKLDFVNDPAFHWGPFGKFPLFSCVDNEQNILANKLTCVSRCEVKDIADQKSPTDPLEVAKIIKTLPPEEFKLIRWASPVDFDDIHAELMIMAEDILLGRANSLVPGEKGR